MTIFRALILAALILPSAARAHDEELKPCGTITKSIRLKKDCLAPMILARDHITVDLDGHTVFGVAPLRSGSIDVIDRRGVTIKNGNIRSTVVLDDRFGLNVLYGGGHTIRNLKVENLAVRIREVDNTLVKQVTISTSQIFPNASASSFNFQGTNSRIVRVRSQGVLSYGAVIAGEALVIANNDFRSETLCGLGLPTERSTVRRNNLTTSSTDTRIGGLCAFGYTNLIKSNTIIGLATGLIFPSNANEFTIRNNYITSDPTAVGDAVDIRAGINACTNTWKNNKFVTDSEGDGPDAGCIR
ncbi:MAG: hypothetical protein RL518_492 [Pseudomonadota bacterium]|jgi:hypothetical protein